GVLGGLLQRGDHHRLHLLHRDRGRPTRPRLVAQPPHPGGAKPRPPLAPPPPGRATPPPRPLPTVAGEPRRSPATCLLSTPSAHASTMRERNANACADFARRDQRTR